MSFKSMIVGALLLGLFIFAMMNISINLSNNNGVDNVLFENSQFNSTYTDIQSELNTSQQEANTTKFNFENERSSFSAGFFLLSSILDAGKTYMGILVGIFTATGSLVEETMGLNEGTGPIVLGVFTAIILISLVLLAWRTYKAGE